MVKEFECFVIDEGTAIVKEEINTKDFKKMIKKVIELRQWYENLI